MLNHINAVSFSPTGNTRRVVHFIAEHMSEQLNISISDVDLTRLNSRQKEYHFGRDELVIIGLPIYAGRLPNKIMPDLKSIFYGNQTPVIAVVCFGNRSAGDGLAELRQVLEEKGFIPIGAAAIVTAHAFSDKIAGERPDETDKKEIKDWCAALTKNIQLIELTGGDSVIALPSVLDRQLAPYYTPLTEDGRVAKFLKAKPVTDHTLCDGCNACIHACPMGSISVEDCSAIPGICIKCQACIKICPHGAKRFEDENFRSHVRMLEGNIKKRAENDFVVRK